MLINLGVRTTSDEKNHQDLIQDELLIQLIKADDKASINKGKESI